MEILNNNIQNLAEMALWILEQDDRLSGKDSSNGKFKTYDLSFLFAQLLKNGYV